MKKWANELNTEPLQRKKFKWLNKQTNKNHEKMLIIPSHKGNANQNHTKIPSHSC
jgi:hypothetical protein